MRKRRVSTYASILAGTPVGLKLDLVLESPVIAQTAGPSARVSSSSGLELGPEICIPTQFPGDAGAGVRGFHFEKHWNRVFLTSRMSQVT